jgi:hypothetical protein
VSICDAYLALHQQVLNSPPLFESLLHVGQLSLLEEVEEFHVAVLLSGHRSESQAGNGSPAPLTASS